MEFYCTEESAAANRGLPPQCWLRWAAGSNLKHAQKQAQNGSRMSSLGKSPTDMELTLLVHIEMESFTNSHQSADAYGHIRLVRSREETQHHGVKSEHCP